MHCKLYANRSGIEFVKEAHVVDSAIETKIETPKCILQYLSKCDFCIGSETYGYGSESHESQ